MKFRYVGEDYTEWFGFKWMSGTEHDVTDEHAVRKLSGSALFVPVLLDAPVDFEPPKMVSVMVQPDAQEIVVPAPDPGPASVVVEVSAEEPPPVKKRKQAPKKDVTDDDALPD